ncbi:hypothetical protein BG53_06335 [Paenibacillus darwinianus]|uniref:Urease accessory protein UreF n=1 Tax=Paenibacillus darwinianus TaxID=1380763 RepID=A0A9W5S0K7_9BACL|nr:hypothetical protein CH50_07405 [Paenibacillus darwinianus]EXX86392.1 hypothetical protein BG53_06335 [Paenibacillus darwinianus]EXX91001.1 hypothetical protein BG52_11650 [Paenibacillus darwinianus]
MFVKEAYEAARRQDAAALEMLQDVCSASKPARELHGASVKTGRSLLLGVRNLYEGQPPEAYSDLLEPSLAYHYAVAYGMTAAMMELPPDEMLQTYLYSGLASLVSVATRIMPLGQNESQLMLFRLSRRINELAIDYGALSLADVNTFAPGMEIAAMEHETIYTRLCMS